MTTPPPAKSPAAALADLRMTSMTAAERKAVASLGGLAKAKADRARKRLKRGRKKKVSKGD